MSAVSGAAIRYAAPRTAAASVGTSGWDRDRRATAPSLEARPAAPRASAAEVGGDQRAGPLPAARAMPTLRNAGCSTIARCGGEFIHIADHRAGDAAPARGRGERLADRAHAGVAPHAACRTTSRRSTCGRRSRGRPCRRVGVGGAARARRRRAGRRRPFCARWALITPQDATARCGPIRAPAWAGTSGGEGRDEHGDARQRVSLHGMCDGPRSPQLQRRMSFPAAEHPTRSTAKRGP